MFKKIILVSMVLIFFLSYSPVLGAPVVNEFMYDLDGADIDWVEVYNNGDAIDLTTLKLTINRGSNHGIVHYSGSQTLNNGDFGVIVQTSQISAFTSRWGNSGNIFTSSFTLPNTEATIEINSGDKENPISGVGYESTIGGAGDGDSLSLVSGSWVASSPTPNTTNQASSGEENEENENQNTDIADEENTNDSTGSSQIKSTTKTSNTSKPKVEIITSAVAYVGIPTAFQGKATGSDGQLYSRGKFFWNFGDGDFREVKASVTDKFNHTYFHEGEYTVLFEYYPNFFAEEPEAVGKVTIKVIVPGVSITKVGDEKDFFLELSNDTTYNIDISRWKLMSDFKVFNFPKNTILSSKKKMIVSSRLTNFSIGDKNTLKLFDSEGELVFNYMQSITAPSTQVVRNTTTRSSTLGSVNNYENFDEENAPEETNNSLSASVLSSGFFNGDSFLPILGSFVFIGASAGAVYFIRKRKSDSSNGDEFEILKD